VVWIIDNCPLSKNRNP